MNKTITVFLIILSFALSLIFVILESASYVYYDAREVYRVYLNGESLGLINSKKELENYINDKQEAIKQKYNVENVYTPNGLKIKEETTYNEQIETVESIYDKIANQEDFTINGYIVTITEQNTKKNNDKKDQEKTKKIKEYLYLLNKNILNDAINDVVKSFVDEKQYDNYLSETNQDLTKEGTSIENVYIKEQITIKKGKIPVNKKIYQTKQELAKYLLFGTNEKNKVYKVKEGDTIKNIAYNNEMSTEEFLIANQNITDENALLYKGQEVIISYINPKITVVEETHSVKKEKVRYKTIEKIDENMMPGHYQIIQKGKKGTSKVTRKIQKQNGKITYALITANEVITEPINKIIKTGSSVDWAWPTVRNYSITEYFGYGLRSDIGESSSRLHDGIDIAGLGCGTPIYAANTGTVEIAGWYYGYGLAVKIDHGKGISTLYGHMNSVSVSPGQQIKKGQRIGTMGNTGYSYGCHLHFTITSNGSYVNPLSFY